MRYVLLLALFLIGCGQSADQAAKPAASDCRGIYYERDSAGNLLKFNQYKSGQTCYTDNMPLSQYEKTQEKWNKNHVQCVPQPGFTSRTLVAANNYYDIRDGSVYLQFDSTTGIYRRVVLAQNEKGESVYAKLQGCFYQRTGIGIDAGFGKQLLLDTNVNKVVTSQVFDPFEIYSYTEVGTDVNMLRFDDTKDYDYRNCPYLRSPWKFCEKLRDGNEMYFPNLPAADQTALTNEAIIISRQFNWSASSKSAFDSLWDSVQNSRKEAVREDYLYDMVHIVDTPRYIDQAWRDYVMGNRPFMPDVNSSTNVSLNLCYPGSKSITFNDGSTGKVYGEVCYVNGQYIFTPN